MSINMERQPEYCLNSNLEKLKTAKEKKEVTVLQKYSHFLKTITLKYCPMKQVLSLEWSTIVGVFNKFDVGVNDVGGIVKLLRHWESLVPTFTEKKHPLRVHQKHH